MSRAIKLLQKALEDPASLRFNELLRLAEYLGFERSRARGSHFIYTHPGLTRPLNFQDVKGMAKPYQVRQLLDAARELGLLTED